MTYDIETMTNRTRFSDAKLDPVLIVGWTLHFTGSGKMIRMGTFTWGSTGVDPITESGHAVHVDIAPTEAEMLMRFRNFCHEADPDVVLGWNNFRFDDTYLDDRATTIFTKGKQPHLLRQFR